MSWVGTPEKCYVIAEGVARRPCPEPSAFHARTADGGQVFACVKHSAYLPGLSSNVEVHARTDECRDGCAFAGPAN